MFKRSSEKYEPKKAGYEAQYLGYKECSSLVVNESIYPIVADIIAKRQADSGSGVNALNITVTKKEFQIVQQLTRRSTRGTKVEKYKFPPIPSCDITHTIQCMTPETVATIILGYNENTKRYLHVHVFRFNTPDIAASFVNHLTDIIKLPANASRLQAIEVDLQRQGELSTGDLNAVYGHQRSPSVDSATMSAMNDLALELQAKLKTSAVHSSTSADTLEEEDMDGPPILLPPRDYDTISRSQGTSILHHRAIVANRIQQQQNASGAGPPDIDTDFRRRTDSPSSFSSAPRSSGSYSPNIVRATHSFGAHDFKSFVRQEKRNSIPFRGSDSLSSADLEAFRRTAPNSEKY